MTSIVIPNDDYASWITDLKRRVHEAQNRAMVAVNSDLVMLYWQIGSEILERQEKHKWGSKSLINYPMI